MVILRRETYRDYMWVHSGNGCLCVCSLYSYYLHIGRLFYFQNIPYFKKCPPTRGMYKICIPRKLLAWRHSLHNHIRLWTCLLIYPLRFMCKLAYLCNSNHQHARTKFSYFLDEMSDICFFHYLLSHIKGILDMKRWLLNMWVSACVYVHLCISISVLK